MPCIDKANESVFSLTTNNNISHGVDDVLGNV